ncbi:hypothetical protein AB1Y20_007846 [Prymnesium parvum]|uniref:Uncharacterized protein n=1 Tax=Prymnesium parvum TaxID=97485 RepID=A0AB34IV18_PRYPA
MQNDSEGNSLDLKLVDYLDGRPPPVFREVQQNDHGAGDNGMLADDSDDDAGPRAAQDKLPRQRKPVDRYKPSVSMVCTSPLVYSLIGHLASC